MHKHLFHIFLKVLLANERSIFEEILERSQENRRGALVGDTTHRVRSLKSAVSFDSNPAAYHEP